MGRREAWLQVLIMPRITIDASQFFRGVSTSADLLDGGFSPEEKGFSLFTSPGLIKPGPTQATTVTQFESNGIIARNLYETLKSPGHLFVMSSNSSLDGTVYEMATTSGSATVLYGPDTGRDYAAGFSDIVRYKGTYYFTSKTNISKDGDFDWWTTVEGETGLNTLGGHWLEVFNDTLYISDGRYLHSWDGTTSTYNALDLPTDYWITATAVFDGLLVIAAEYFSGNTTDRRHGRTKLFTWDGFSPSFLSETDLPEHIDCLIPFGGSLYVTTQDHFGYFNGRAIVPLRSLSTQVRRHQVAVYKDRVYMAQGDSLLCYGNPIPGRARFFSYPLRTAGTIDGVATGYGPRFWLSNGTSSVYVADIDSGSSSCTFKGNKIPTGDVSLVRKITVELEAVAAATDINVRYVNSRGETKVVGTISTSLYATGVCEVEFDVENDIETLTIQPVLVFNSPSAEGVRRLHIDYDYAESRASA